jgi:hypothetical protein
MLHTLIKIVKKGKAITRANGGLGMGLCFAFLLFFQTLWGQVGSGQYSPLVCSFNLQSIELQQGQAIANVLSVKNKNGIVREFYLEITAPNDWQVLTSSRRVYKVAPDDSLYIPVRMVPNLATMKGGTKYNISVFVVGTDGRAHAVCNFLVSKPRVVKWDMEVLPRSRIYFLNDELTAPLAIRLRNQGDDEQQINLSWKVLGRGLNLYTDSLSQRRQFIDFSLPNDKDTTLNFKADLSVPDRNFRRIDMEEYRPISVFESRKYTLYFNAIEPRGTKTIGAGKKTANADLVKLNNSVDFVKLSSTYYMTQFGSAVLPIIWYSNIYNVLGLQPVWQNTFRADYRLPNQASLNGFVQHFFTFYTPTRETYTSKLQGVISYSSLKLDAVLGGPATFRERMLMAGGITGGRGINLTFRPNSKWSINTFGGRNQNLFDFINNNGNIYGLGFSFLPNRNFGTALGYSQSNNPFAGSRLQSIPSGLFFNLGRNHSFSASFSQIIKTDSLNTNNSISRNFNNWGLSYSGRFFKGILSQNLSVFKNSLFFLNNTSIPRANYFINYLTTLNLSSLSIQFNTAYFENNFAVNPINNQPLRNFTVPSNLSINFKKSKTFRVFPSLFHTYTRLGEASGHQKGIFFNTNVFNYENNTLLALGFRGGYNSYRDSTGRYPELFNAQVFLMATYRTFSGNVRYTYGPLDFFGVQQFHLNPTRYPQYVFSTLTKQHVFRNPRFVGDFSVNHSWNNILYNHNLGLSPQLFYFTTKGWRFNVMAFYNLSARNTEKAVQFYQFQGVTIPSAQEEQGVVMSSNFNLSFGIRKEIGVPLPKKWAKVLYTDATFIAFLDFNGNKVMDKDDVPLENIVVKVNGHEAITNKDGKAMFKNVPQQSYEHLILPLIDLNGWFTYQKDSIEVTSQQTYYIPYTRGVKIEGSIILDREKFTKDILAELDLSKIRIFTTDTLGNTYATLTDRKGNFSFYVPYGYYALSMDESILSDRFFVAQNNIPIELEEGMDSYYQAFFIIEKRRRVKKKVFDKDGNLVEMEEVSGNNYNTTDSTKTFDASNIFNEDKRTGKSPALSKEDLNLLELDKRIAKLDSLIALLSSQQQQTQTVTSTQYLIAQALRMLKQEEQKNANQFQSNYTVLLYTQKKGDNPVEMIKLTKKAKAIDPKVTPQVFVDAEGNQYLIFGKFSTKAAARNALNKVIATGQYPSASLKAVTDTEIIEP